MTETGAIARRAGTLGVVILLHVVLLAALMAGGVLRPAIRLTAPARLIFEPSRRRPEPPPVPLPILVPPAAFVPVPEIAVAAPVLRKATLRAVSHAAPPAVSQGHFGAAADSGLGLDVGTLAGGGAGDRGSLAGFEAAVRRQVQAGKRQPVLAWDRRNTCVVEYTVHVTAAGRLAGSSIEPCAIPEINAAARDAIRQAVFPRPPGLGADYEIHGSLVFRP